MKRLIGLAGLALCFWHGAAVANLISFDFSFPGVNLDPSPDTGTVVVTFRLSYDSAAVDTNSDPNGGAYAAKLSLISGATSSPVLDVTLNVGNVAPPGGGGTFDEFGIPQVNFPLPFPTVDGHGIDSASFSLLSDTGEMLANDKLPLTLDFASKANRAFVVLHRADSETANSLPFEQGEFESISSPVPEPSTYLILLSGIAGLLSLRRLRVV